jgi:hypothetical protein
LQFKNILIKQPGNVLTLGRIENLSASKDKLNQTTDNIQCLKEEEN